MTHDPGGAAVPGGLAVGSRAGSRVPRAVWSRAGAAGRLIRLSQGGLEQEGGKGCCVALLTCSVAGCPEPGEADAVGGGGG